MTEVIFKPTIEKYSTCKEFAEAYQIGKGDLVVSNRYIYEPSFGALNLKCDFIFQEEYGMGEPTDEMFEAICHDMKGEPKRIIAIGGGTILDICKIMALKKHLPVLGLYDGTIKPEKGAELILIPTTCGTGSEVTNVAVLALISRSTKKGLAMNEMYADSAVLIPELLNGLPFCIFATSSIDALVHAVESCLSPKATAYTRLFGYKAIEILIRGYQKIAAYGPEARIPLLEDFLIAANFAGLSFGTAGCAAVHAMAYPLGGKYHITHGESNYACFTGVLKKYMEVRTDGEIAVMSAFLANLLNCGADDTYNELESLLDNILPRKALHKYGVTREDIPAFAQNVIDNQQRLLVNSFIPMDYNQVLDVYSKLY